MQLQFCGQLAAKHGDFYAHLARGNVDLLDSTDGTFHRAGGDLHRIADLVVDQVSRVWPYSGTRAALVAFAYVSLTLFGWPSHAIQLAT